LTALSAKARRHLARRDPVMKAMTAVVGRCTLQPGGEPFVVLVRSIIAQLISTKAACSIYARVLSATGETGVTPSGMLGLGEQRLREQGLSLVKARAILDLAARGSDGRLPLDRLDELSDEDIVARLIEVPGIGRWTAEMFLIFALGRPDVLPIGDFGLRAGVRDWYKLEDLPGAKQLREIGAVWQPYRSIGTWYVWRSRGAVPQS
jgi:DNA-3-methyladenine glycosylase II